MEKLFIVGVAGGTGSGKTTIVNAALEKLNHPSVVVIQHDSYYKDRSNIPRSEREKINYDHPDAFETDLLICHLQDLIDGKPINKPIYDFVTHTRKKEVEIVKPAKCIIIEGILVHAEKALRDLLDIKIYVDTDPDIRFIRRLQRDLTERGRSLDSVIQQYMETVRPVHIEFVEPSKSHADIILLDSNASAIETVVSLLEKSI